MSSFGGIVTQVQGVTYRFSSKHLEALDRLLRQLHSQRFAPSLAFVRKTLIENEGAIIYFVEEGGEFVGTVTLTHHHTLLGHIATAHDLVVDQDHRKKGYGRMLMTRLIEGAERLEVEYLEFNFGPYRMPTHMLFKDLGFRRTSTFGFRLDFPRPPQNS
ncbi:MAG: GNAT family N-acetyltransferase [Candidatus Saccharimonadia bacterium]